MLVPQPQLGEHTQQPTPGPGRRISDGGAGGRQGTSLNGSVCRFDSQDAWFRQVGINLRVLEPGQPNGFHHFETQQEAAFVLSGECRLLVNGEERLLRQWDFFHCPAGTEHVCVGAGDGPCVILMVGARTEDGEILYPVSELAARYGASVETETANPTEAYAPFGPPQPAKPPSWEQLPWA